LSFEQLEALRRARAFEQAPVRSELHELHVPFDTLVDGGGGGGPWEASLDAALRRGERAALIGASGNGKSSLMQYVLRPTVDLLAPLAIDLRWEDRTMVTEPAAFAAHIVARVHRYVQASLPKRAGEASALAGSRGSARSHGLKLTLPWLSGGGVELASELESASEATARSGADHVEAAQGLIELIKHAGLQPVLVLDDIDKWVRDSGGGDDEQLRVGFFTRIVRLIAEDLGCAAVVAVHPTYLDDAAYREGARFLSRPVTLPRLSTAAAVGAVLSHRQVVAGDGGKSAWSPEAIDAVFTAYSGTPALSMRSLLILAHTSLAVACTVGAQRIEEEHVHFAVRELRP
jgi:hypothetical protein